jgi:hypothetical protein
MIIPMPLVADALRQIGEQDYAVKVCRVLFENVPGGPPFVVYPDLAGAVARVQPAAPGDAVFRAEAIAIEPDVEKALWVAEALDKADMGLAAFAGLKNVFSLFTGSRSRARTFESDKEQAGDAGVKLVGIGYMATKLFPGPPNDCAARFMALPAGREMLLYFAAVEVALPFADNLAEGAGSIFTRLAGLASGDGRSRFGKVLGLDAVSDSGRILQSFRAPLEQYLGTAARHVDPLTAGLRRFVPSALGAADSLTGLAAGTLDALPVWRFLGARLAAEAAASRAVSPAS